MLLLACLAARLFADQRIFVSRNRIDKITLIDDGSCSVLSQGRSGRGFYEIKGKRIVLDVAGHHVRGFWYGDVIRLAKSSGYESFKLKKTPVVYRGSSFTIVRSTEAIARNEAKLDVKLGLNPEQKRKVSGLRRTRDVKLKKAYASVPKGGDVRRTSDTQLHILREYYDGWRSVLTPRQKQKLEELENHDHG